MSVIIGTDNLTGELKSTQKKPERNGIIPPKYLGKITTNLENWLHQFQC